MRYPQLLIYEGDGRLAAQLRTAAQAQNWSLREPRQPESCLRLLRRGGPGVLVLKVGRDLVREMTLLEQVCWQLPDAACVVVGDAEDAVVAGLAWDLGAHAVLFPPQPREQLSDILVGLMGAATAAVPKTEKARPHA
jgi:hypothetical protein